ncbi:MAG: DUF1844 domain-containing protein [Planctomycetota bacterium]|jgi:hypothetical protein
MSDETPKLHIEGDFKAEAQAEKEQLAAEEAGASPGIQVDSDWKAQARAEKERLAATESEKKGPASGERGELPEASFKTLMGSLASQAIMGLGAMQDPNSGGVMIDLEGAKFAIDLLAVLDEKTKGNLEAEEAEEMKQVLAELRSRFVQIKQLVEQQQAAGGGIPGAAGAPGIQAPGRGDIPLA